MLKDLADIASILDSRGLREEADYIDLLIRRASDQGLEHDEWTKEDDERWEREEREREAKRKAKQKDAITAVRPLQLSSPSDLGYQLFVPDGVKRYKNKEEGRVHNDYFDLNNLGKGRRSIYGEVHMGWADKPSGAFWTSTLDTSSLSSEWLDLCRSDFSQANYGKEAAIFRIKDSAKIIRIQNSEDYKVLMDAHSSNRVRGGGWRFWGQMREVPEDQQVRSVDWGVFAEEYDAVYCTNKSCLPGWDAESIAWFNMDALELVDVVSITEDCRLNLNPEVLNME